CVRSRPLRLALLAGLLSSGGAPPQDPAVQIEDLTPQFLRFYDSAASQHADPQRRWDLWRRLYGFAAVPPTPYGDSLARRLLDSAWDRYPAALSTIARGAAGLGIFPDSAFRRVAGLLGCGDTVKVRLTVFVGGFEGNAFAYGHQNGRYGIAVPVEAGDPARSIIHELTHALHRGGCATFPSGYGQSVAELVVTEGLAMQVVRRALPGHDADYYTAAAPGWLADARARRRAILEGIRQHWTEHGPAAVQRFTFGAGTTGLHREGYYAGWELVGAMLDRLGMSLHDVATTDPAQYPALLAKAMRVAE
ncbi:MAG TPA: DUF2268 domain-containing putative Zn-dependent protease, partial [Gemmatimonadales bacterium]|nr:DUF2268 domain-containing putative Zn-dependent protease [Gemmatimonadales bacterium]